MPKSGKRMKSGGMSISWQGEGSMPAEIRETLDKIATSSLMIPKGLKVEFVDAVSIVRPDNFFKDRAGEYNPNDNIVRVAADGSLDPLMDIAWAFAHEIGHADHIQRDLKGFKAASWVEREKYANRVAAMLTGVHVDPRYYRHYRELDRKEGRA